MLEKNVEKREALWTAGGNGNWGHHYGEKHRNALKIKKKGTYNSAILLLGIYLTEMKALSQKDYLHPQCSLSVFTTAKT